MEPFVILWGQVYIPRRDETKAATIARSNLERVGETVRTK